MIACLQNLLALACCAAAVWAAPAGMVEIPAGQFKPLFRGDAEPKAVSVRAFHLDALPVTNGDFLKFVESVPQWRRSNVKRLFADPEYLKHWAGDLELGATASTNAPVTRVSWFAAKAYAQWKGKRLPTTTEWEYAAAASPARPDGANDLAFTAAIRRWYATPSPEQIPAVGQNAANFFGVHDLHGLVWEWVADFNTAMVTGDARGDTGLDRQLFCGSGSQGAKDRDDFPAFMRYGFRSSLNANYTVPNLGFRCAQNIQP